MRVAPLENQVKVISQNNVNILSGLNGLESEVKSIENSQETLGAKIANIEEQIQKLTTIPEIKSELVIPIKRDKAMAALTDTEIAVLEMLSSEGSKTAPEIKDRLQLSREHTARLMKKLYEEGYLEREVGKIPFRYSIKKEMERLLKKTENSQPT
jgi:DNA-binding MarR family transcriptional regulator